MVSGGTKTSGTTTEAPEIGLSTPFNGPTVANFNQWNTGVLENWANRLLAIFSNMSDQKLYRQLLMQLHEFVILLDVAEDLNNKVTSFSYQMRLVTNTGSVESVTNAVRDYEKMLDVAVRFAIMLRLITQANEIYHVRFERK